MPIRVLMVDDHSMVLEGLAAVLDDEDCFKVIGKVGSVPEALAAIEDPQPDVVVMDVHLYGLDGIQGCALIKELYPEVRVVVMTGVAGDDAAAAAFEAGADGFTLKESDGSILRDAVKTVAGGGTYIDPRTTGKLVALVLKAPGPKTPYGLTPQELRVLALLPDGLMNIEIADELCLSVHTIKTHLRNATRKLGAKDRKEAASMVVQEGLD